MIALSPHSRALVVAALALAVPAGCSPQRVAVRYAADALADSSGGSVWSGDDDPELVRDAMPFALKTMESLLAAQPAHVGLHEALAAGFTQYAFGFVKPDADYAEDSSLAKAQEGWDRARTLLERARRYGFAGLDLKHPGFTARFRKDAAKAVRELCADDVGLAYWAGAALGAEITLSKDRPEIIAELPAVGVLMQRLLALDEDYGDGSVHEFMVSFEAGRPASMGGSVERARRHLQRVEQLTGSHKAGLYVSWAESVAVANQDRKLFEKMLDQALAVDVNAVPRYRLANLIAQRRARWLKARAEELILSADEPTENP